MDVQNIEREDVPRVIGLVSLRADSLVFITGRSPRPTRSVPGCGSESIDFMVANNLPVISSREMRSS